MTHVMFKVGNANAVPSSWSLPGYLLRAPSDVDQDETYLLRKVSEQLPLSKAVVPEVGLRKPHRLWENTVC